MLHKEFNRTVNRRDHSSRDQRENENDLICEGEMKFEERGKMRAYNLICSGPEARRKHPGRRPDFIIGYITDGSLPEFIGSTCSNTVMLIKMKISHFL